jgi:hypothetical protein
MPPWATPSSFTGPRTIFLFLSESEQEVSAQAWTMLRVEVFKEEPVVWAK